MENDRFTLKVGEQDIECNKENTSLLTFLGKTSLAGVEVDASRFDCVAVQLNETEDDDEPSDNLLVFSTNPGYEELKRFLIVNKFPLYMYQRCIPDAIHEAYNRSLFNGWESELDEPQPDN